MKKETKEKILELHRQGYPTGQIAEILHVTEFEVIRTLERAGLRRAM